MAEPQQDGMWILIPISTSSAGAKPMRWLKL
jgi:hypothetical protein